MGIGLEQDRDKNTNTHTHKNENKVDTVNPLFKIMILTKVNHAHKNITDY